MSADHSMQALLVNGTVGVGNTSVAAALGRRLADRGLPGLVIDLDGLRDIWPSPSDDPFHLELTLRNLASVTRHGVEAGARHVVLAGVLESRDERTRYAESVQMPLIVCRLRADHAVVSERLVHRHAGDPDGLAWHLRRSRELAEILDRVQPDDFVLDATRADIGEIADDILSRWLGPSEATVRLPQ